MERQFNLVLDANVELELIQVDFDGVLDLLDHYQIPDSKRKRVSRKILGQSKKSKRFKPLNPPTEVILAQTTLNWNQEIQWRELSSQIF